MKISPLSMQGLRLIETEPYCDHRGRFARLFCCRELASAGLDMEIVQINHSLTRQVGAIRGLHFQRAPYAETKIVRCLRGGCFDVVVDLRPDSETFLKWHGEKLTDKNDKALFIPEGFAHGFQTIEPDTELLYFHSEYYTSEYEGGVRFDDPALGIDWPLLYTDISDRDMNFPLINIDS